MKEDYEGVLTIQVRIPPEMIENPAILLGDMQDLEDIVDEMAEGELHMLIAAFRAAHRG